MPNGIADKSLMPASSSEWTTEEIMDWEVKEALRFAPFTHPLDQSGLYVPFPLYEWQRDVLAGASCQHSRAICSTANESGKTSTLIVVFGLSMMNAYPGCKVYSTSGSDRQVREQLFEQQLKPLIDSEEYRRAGWKIKTGSEMKVTAPNGSEWLGYVCSDALTAEGFHGYWKEVEGKKRYCPCVYIVDEAKSVGDGVHEAIRRIDPDYWLTLSTPGAESGWFHDGINPDTLRVNHTDIDDYEVRKRVQYLNNYPYGVDPAHDYREEYENLDSQVIFTYRRMVDWNDCPHLHTEKKALERKKLIRKYGMNSAFIQSMLYGNFQRSEDFNLIYTDEDLELMKSAMRGDNRERTVGSDVEAAGDISGGSGGDDQVLMLRIGSEVVLQDHHQCPIDLDQADYWVGMLRKLGINPWQFTVDGGGLGATVANYMEQRLNFMGVKRAQANTGPKFKFEFRDKYTEVHFFLKELLSARVLHIEGWNDKLLKQMRSRRFVEMEAGEKIKTEGKREHRKREKESPDDLDTLIYLLYDFDPYLLANVIEKAKQIHTSDEPTEMERKAAKVANEGELFAGMRNMSGQRNRVMGDMRRYNRKFGRG